MNFALLNFPSGMVFGRCSRKNRFFFHYHFLSRCRGGSLSGWFMSLFARYIKECTYSFRFRWARSLRSFFPWWKNEPKKSSGIEASALRACAGPQMPHSNAHGFWYELTTLVYSILGSQIRPEISGWIREHQKNLILSEQMPHSNAQLKLKSIQIQLICSWNNPMQSTTID